MVATAAQLAANRANASRSTGPRTPEGKAASSRNALTHGAYAADDTILATSSDTYLEDFRARFQPADALEDHLVEHLAVLASRRKRLQLAMDALLELNERHALIEHLHERYGINTPNARIPGQPSWQAAMRRYDGNTYVDPRFPEPVSDPALDPDPILCSLAYTLSSPRAAALFRHEAAVDRRFSATLKELTTLQARRQTATAANGTLPAGPLYEPRLQRALDRHLRDTATAQTNPSRDPIPAVPSLSPTAGTPTTLDPAPISSSGHQAAAPDRATAQTTSLLVTPSSGAQPLVLDQTQSLPPQRETVSPVRRNEANWLDHLFLEDEPTGFRSVLPRSDAELSSIPAHWPDTMPATTRNRAIEANAVTDATPTGHPAPDIHGPLSQHCP
jgi:hypothetical protein